MYSQALLQQQQQQQQSEVAKCLSSMPLLL
jgi:hypothetical protein